MRLHEVFGFATSRKSIFLDKLAAYVSAVGFKFVLFWFLFFRIRNIKILYVVAPLLAIHNVFDTMRGLATVTSLNAG